MESSAAPASPRSARSKDDPERIKAEAAKKREFAVTILSKSELENGMKAFREARTCLQSNYSPAHVIWPQLD